MFWVIIATFFFTLLPAQADPYIMGCPDPCDKTLCDPLPADCYSGEVHDQCSCCPACAAGEGEACGGTGRFGEPVCGEGMVCLVSDGVGFSATVRRRGKSGVCVCQSPERVCGSDGVTYRNVCELRRVANRAQRLQQPPVIFIQRGACGQGTWTKCTWNICRRTLLVLWIHHLNGISFFYIRQKKFGKLCMSLTQCNFCLSFTFTPYSI